MPLLIASWCLMFEFCAFAPGNPSWLEFWFLGLLTKTCGLLRGEDSRARYERLCSAGISGWERCEMMVWCYDVTCKSKFFSLILVSSLPISMSAKSQTIQLDNLEDMKAFARLFVNEHERICWWNDNKNVIPEVKWEMLVVTMVTELVTELVIRAKVLHFTVTYHMKWEMPIITKVTELVIWAKVLHCAVIYHKNFWV